jgi:hypothetical protein
MSQWQYLTLEYRPADNAKVAPRAIGEKLEPEPGWYSRTNGRLSYHGNGRTIGSILDVLGANGWELVGIESVQDGDLGGRYVFKQPLVANSKPTAERALNVPRRPDLAREWRE